MSSASDIATSTEPQGKTQILKRLLRPTVLLWVIGSLFGIVFIALIPPGFNPDEASHFYRVAQVAQGEIVGHDVVPGDPPDVDGKPVDQIGGEIPQSVTQLFDQSGATGGLINGDIYGLASSINWGDIWSLPSKADHTAVTMVNTEAYSPIVYIPSVIPYWIGQLLNLPILLVFYLGRVLNLLTALTLTWIAIRLIPRGKWALLILALLPTTVIEAGAISGDPVTNGLAFLAIAVTLRAAFQDSPIRRMQWLGILASFVAVGLAKPAYITLLGLLVAIPLCNRHARNWRSWAGWAITAAIGGLTAILWQRAVSWIPPINQSIEKVDTQYAFALSHPVETLKTLFRTFLTTNTPIGGGGRFLREIFGTAVWLRINIAEPFVIGLSGAMLASPLITEPGDSTWRGTRRSRGILTGGLVVLFIISSALLAIGLYAVWTEPQLTSVIGLQGRYFIAILPLALLALVPWKSPLTQLQTRLKCLVTGMLMAGLIAMLWEVWSTLWRAAPATHWPI